jgi:hypothetical protein
MVVTEKYYYLITELMPEDLRTLLCTNLQNGVKLNDIETKVSESNKEEGNIQVSFGRDQSFP